MDGAVGGLLIPTVPQNVLNQETVLQDSPLLCINAHHGKLPYAAAVD